MLSGVVLLGRLPCLSRSCYACIGRQHPYRLQLCISPVEVATEVAYGQQKRPGPMQLIPHG